MVVEVIIKRWCGGGQWGILHWGYGKRSCTAYIQWLFCSVGELVALENTSSSTWIVALVTPERLLSWMRQHVFLEVRYCCAGEFKHCVQLKGFSPEWKQVCFEAGSCCAAIITLCAAKKAFLLNGLANAVTSCCGGVAALCANKRLLSRVGEHVSLEDTSCCAGVVALFANKRLLSTVNHHVHFQMIRFDGWVAALQCIGIKNFLAHSI